MAQKRKKKKTASKKRRVTQAGKRRASKKRVRRSAVSLSATAKAICTALPRECVAAGKKHARALELYGHTVSTYFVTAQRVGKAILRFTTNKRTGKTTVSV